MQPSAGHRCSSLYPLLVARSGVHLVLATFDVLRFDVRLQHSSRSSFSSLSCSAARAAPRHLSTVCSAKDDGSDGGEQLQRRQLLSAAAGAALLAAGAAAQPPAAQVGILFCSGSLPDHYGASYWCGNSMCTRQTRRHALPCAAVCWHHGLLSPLR